MKTAVQIAVEKLEQFIPAGNQLSIRLILDEALEKEKEQICNAYTDGLEGPYIGAEEYYNQTYNQKIPELLYKDGTPMRKVKLSKEAQELLDEATKRFNQPNLCCTR